MSEFIHSTDIAKGTYFFYFKTKLSNIQEYEPLWIQN